MLFSVFSQTGGKHQHLKVSPQIFVFEALSLDLPGEAFLRPHLLIMRQYLIFQLKQEEILYGFCLWTPLVMAINEFPITHCSCLLLCQLPLTPLLLLIPAVVGLQGWAFPSLYLCHFCPSNRANLFQQAGTGHTFPWKSWPEGLALAFPQPHERQWCLLLSSMSAHGFWDTFLSKLPDEGENLLLWECWVCQIWKEMGLSTVNINSTNPIFGGFSHCLRTPWLLKILWSHIPPGVPWGSYLFKDLFSLLD